MLEAQRQMLDDPLRNQSLERAMREVIRPGMIVADVGAGTGYLSVLAARMGAKRIHVIEYTGLLELARKVARVNGVERACTFHHAHSLSITLPEKVDVILCETLGSHALEEHVLETLADAHRRFLRAGGVSLPSAVETWVQPVVARAAVADIDCWGEVTGGVDLAPARPIALARPYAWTVAPEHLGLQPQRLDVVGFDAGEPSLRDRSVEVVADRAVTIHGLCLWWVAQLSPGVTLSTSPHEPLTHWRQILCVLPEPVTLARDERCTLHVRSDTRLEVGFELTWRVSRPGARAPRKAAARKPRGRTRR